MLNENNISSVITTVGQAPQAKQPWIAPVIEVLDLRAARSAGAFTFKDSTNRS